MAPRHASLQRALAAWRRALGPAHVCTDEPTLAEAGATTFAPQRTVLAILSPADTAQVQAVLRIAQRHRVPVSPTSGGKNWGYGGRAPVARRAVLLDLSRLARIVACDEALGTLTVKPGVTFAQAHAYLAAQGSTLRLTAIGSSPEASLVGNAMERGDGAGPHADVFAYACALCVVLPDGRLLRTGLSRYPGAKAQHVHRWGVGPSLDGLFTQSNLGVVTQMTFWLARRSAHAQDFEAHVETPALPRLVDTLRGLLQEGTVRGSVFLWDDAKAFSALGQYPFEETRGRTPLPPAMAATLRARLGVAPWSATGALEEPSEAQASAARARLEAVLGPAVDSLDFAPAGGPDDDAPTSRNLAMLYWRKRTPVPETIAPERDRCGALWVTCAVPFRGSDAALAADVCGRVPPLFGFEPNRAFIAVSPRCLYVIAAVLYDRDQPGHDARAMQCHDALLRELTEAGFPACRLGVQAPAPPPSDDATGAVLRALKRLVDPGRVLAPGRYGL